MLDILSHSLVVFLFMKFIFFLLYKWELVELFETYINTFCEFCVLFWVTLLYTLLSVFIFDFSIFDYLLLPFLVSGLNTLRR